jgi:hypothetical protein
VVGVRRTLARLLPLAAGVLAASFAAAPALGAVTAPSGPRATEITGSSVVIIGISGLRWSDISATASPALWRLAETGSAGSLVVSAVHTRTCPADAWLTLNSGARAAAQPAATTGTGSARGGSGAPCPPLPTVARVVTSPTGNSGSTGPGTVAAIPAMPRIVTANQPLHYNPDWGLLARAAGPGGCATAAGPGAALALAGPGGHVSSYLPSAAQLTRQVLGHCPLTVIDLGALPSGSGPGGAAARARALRTADTETGRISALLPAGARLVVAGLGDDSAPHLRAIIVTGPGYSGGQLAAASTRQPGMTLVTDLTPTVLGWRGVPVPATAVGSPVTSTSRGPLAATVRGLIGQDTTAQVYRATILVFFLVYGFGEAVLFGVLALLLRGRDEARRRRRRSVYTAAGVLCGSVPAGTFLASLVPWWLLPHPALLLYTMAAGWAVLIAAAALAGPWRHDPLGPPGAVAAVTVAVIGLDVMTGSRLQLGTPFGLSTLEAGRFYGVGNNALGVYGASGILLAAWAGAALLRRSRARAVAVVAVIALFTVVASGWPGFGAKVGGTIAMVPGFLLVLAAVAGVHITWRRGLLLIVSGLVLVTGFAVLNYLVPATGPSDIGAFVGHVLHGGSGGILQRKISANVGSLTTTIYSPIVPLAVIAAALVLAWPDRFRLAALDRAYGALPLLRPALTAIWLVAVLGWLADDSGVTVPAAAIPLALLLTIAIVSAVPGFAPDGENGDGRRVTALCPQPERRANL